MAEVPEVSIVIPTRNRWQLLQPTLQSALAQRGVSTEVLVIDDGSDDETPERLALLDDPRVRVFRNETSGGVAAARNVGIRNARASWVAFLDDDDLWSPDKLRRQLAVANSEDAIFAYGAAVFVDEALDVIEALPPPSPDDLLRSLLPANPMPAGSSNIIARRDILQRLDGFDESLFQLEDWDLWIRLAETGRPAVCREPLVACRLHGGNRIVRQEASVMEEIERLAVKHADLAMHEGLEIDRVRYTRWIAWIRRREGRRLSAAAVYLRGAIRYRNAGNVTRAVGALLGERAMRLGQTLGERWHGGAETSPPSNLTWLAPYR